MDELKIKAFCEYSNCEEDEIELRYDNCLEYEGDEWTIFTDEEAEDAEKEWLEEYVEEMLRCSDIPDWIYPYFNQEAWISDNLGERGQALSPYDGEEVEITTITENNNRVHFYMYRQ